MGVQDGGKAHLWPASLGSTLPAAFFTLHTFWKPCAMLLAVLDRHHRLSPLPTPDGRLWMLEEEQE